VLFSVFQEPLAMPHPIPATAQESVSEKNASLGRSLQKKIDRVIIFYSDGTFTESKPSD
jgi:hypothetical protein